jgi:hypothetical protein
MDANSAGRTWIVVIILANPWTGFKLGRGGCDPVGSYKNRSLPAGMSHTPSSRWRLTIIIYISLVGMYDSSSRRYIAANVAPALGGSRPQQTTAPRLLPARKTLATPIQWSE